MAIFTLVSLIALRSSSVHFVASLATLSLQVTLYYLTIAPICKDYFAFCYFLLHRLLVSQIKKGINELEFLVKILT